MAKQAAEGTAALPPALWALMFGNFVIGTGVMIVPGTLNDISQSLLVPVPVAGQLISAAALVMCLGAPFLATIIGRWDRRQMLTLTMVWFGLWHFLGAFMPNFYGLLSTRMLGVVASALFTPQAAACIALLTVPSQRGRAITLVFLGWSIASVAGMPLGAWIGGTLGWRSAFATVGLLSLISAMWVWRALPDGVRPPLFSAGLWPSILRSKALMLCVAVTALASAGQFVLFAYIAPYLKSRFEVSALELSLVFAWYGTFGFLGNLLVSNHIDRLGPARSSMLAMGAIALSLTLWPLGVNLIATCLVLVPWGLGCFAANSSQQARLSALAPSLVSGSIALNTSAIYAGQAVGAASGGWLIAHQAMSSLHWAGLGFMTLALGTSWLALRTAQVKPAQTHIA